MGVVAFVMKNDEYNGKVNGPSKHVLFLGLDGLGSRNLARAKTPNIDFIKNNGAWTSEVSIDPNSNGSGPNWVGMLSGHDSTTSDIVDHSCKKPKYPTVIDQLMQANKTVAVSTQWHKVKCFINNVTYYQDEKRTLTDIPRLINTVHRGYSFIFIHVDNLDFLGHRVSGGSNTYTKEVEKVDNDYVGPLLDYVKHTDDYTLLIASDHGHELTSKDHSNDAVSFFMYGKGIQRGKLQPMKNVAVYEYLKKLTSVSV
jgi:2,3-bisphosphoglycerate-independent phosphoglycerate mutase